MKKLSPLLFSLGGLFFVSCAHLEIHQKTQDALPAVPRKVVRGTYQSFLWETVRPYGPVTVDANCKAGWDELSVEIAPLQILYRVLSLNLYCPSTVQIVCAPVPLPPAVRR